MRRALLLFPLILVPVALASAKPPSLALPYGLLVDHKGRVFIADAGRHQVLRYGAQRQRLVRVAGNGKAGIGGDGGPALRARLGEIASLAEDSTGQLYVSDVHNGVVRRFVPGGRIATVARVPGAVGIDIDPGGKYLAIASIERGVMRLDLSTGGLETLVPVGQGVDGPHGLRYDASGDLWVADPGSRVIRIDHSSGELNEVARIDTATVLPTARGRLRHRRKPQRWPGAPDSPGRKPAQGRRHRTDLASAKRGSGNARRDPAHRYSAGTQRIAPRRPGSARPRAAPCESPRNHHNGHSLVRRLESRTGSVCVLEDRREMIVLAEPDTE